MSVPQPGDILIRKDGVNKFVLVDVMLRQYIAGPFHVFERAVAVAHMRAARAVWQQPIDEFGEPLGDLVRVIAA
jgi:hypothetical protein